MSFIKTMQEQNIPIPLWIISGIIVVIFSLIVILNSDADSSNLFFYIMFFVGFGLIGWGFFQIRNRQTKAKNRFDERRKEISRRKDLDVTIDGNNPNKQVTHNVNERLEKTHHSHEHNSNSQLYCPRCGVPVLKNHKKCPMCGQVFV